VETGRKSPLRNESLFSKQGVLQPGLYSLIIDFQLIASFGIEFGLLSINKKNMEEEPEGRHVEIRLAVPADSKFVYPILEEMERSAKARGTGIARRTPQSLCQKIYDGKAVIAVTPDGEWAGFSYIETWSNGEFVSNSGLIVRPEFRGTGVASMIKQKIFEISRERYPHASVFSITTGAAVMKMNHRLGFEPVTYDQVTRDERFWEQCRQCVNYGILDSTRRTKCLCTAMVFKPKKEAVLV
jgi:GNAT superfamily N-acetyltransferase